MAKGAFSHTAAILAQVYNINRGEGEQAIKPDALNPYIAKPVFPFDPEYEALFAKNGKG